MDANLSRGYYHVGREPKSEPQTPTEGHRGRRNLPPQDKYKLIYFALLLAGAGFLLPYNSFITAVDYLQRKYPGSTIVFDMSLTYICMAFVSVCVNNVLVETFRLTTRITFGYILSFVTLLFIAVFDVWLELFSRDVSYKINLVAVAIVALGCTVQQSSFYGYTSMLPKRYTQAVMTGESAAGLLVSINRILTKAFVKDEKINTIIFFVVSIVIVLACFIIFHVSRRTDFVRYYIFLCQSAGIPEDQRGIQSNAEEVDIIDNQQMKDRYGVLQITSPTTPTEQKTFSPPDGESSVTVSPPIAAAVAQESEVQIKGRGKAFKKHLSMWESIKRGILIRHHASKNVWPFMLSIALAYFVTLCLFPGVESEIISCSLGSWMPVILMGLFNLFDFIGKLISAIPYDWPRGRLVLCSIARVVIVPLLMLCAAPRRQPLLRGDAWSMLFSILLGISNGYFGSVPMIIASTKVPDEQKEITGNIMTLSYSVGLTTGSAVAYSLDAWLGPHLLHSPCGEIPNLTGFIHNGTSMIQRRARGFGHPIGY
ncbi:equilibrative nucleoside transporter 4-like isoform X2 [Lineus longissimus]|uniref:equilibrative nucleoside transporter 4-like isoform X2 n=1 Tax=Lineus longissimus TaxID=88925 RepID=UPI00315CA2BC